MTEKGYVKRTPAGNLVKHGGSGMGYRTYGCRCGECTEANRARAVTERSNRREKLRGIPDTVVHGKNSTYRNWGCRCDECKAAGASSYAKYYHRTLSSEARRKQREKAYDTGYDDGSTGKPNENPDR